jgi:RNA recognition motif-containing protein
LALFRAPGDSRPKDDDEGAVNPGSNLFVTGIHPRLTESDITRLFEKYGDVENCSIMLDPHTKESRGFGFVKMVTGEQADAAKEGLQGEVIEGRTLSIEKARRARPRTPTPGKYFGPPKRGELAITASVMQNSDSRNIRVPWTPAWWP